MTRKKNQSISIGGFGTIQVSGIFGDKVRIGIVFPKEVPIQRTEVLESKAAACKMSHGSMIEKMALRIHNSYNGSAFTSMRELTPEDQERAINAANEATRFSV